MTVRQRNDGQVGWRHLVIYTVDDAGLVVLAVHLGHAVMCAIRSTAAPGAAMVAQRNATQLIDLCVES
jgi:hypothetical protein